MKILQMKEIITVILEGYVGCEIAIGNLKRLKGGYSREMWAFDVASLKLNGEFVLCADADDGVVESGNQSLSRCQEFELIRYLKTNNLNVPDVYCCGDESSVLGKPFFIMEKVQGIAAVGPLINDPQYSQNLHQYAEQLIGSLDLLQRLSVPSDSTGIFPAPVAAIDKNIQVWRDAYKSIPSAYSSNFDSAYQWLLSNIPADNGSVCIVHGDFRMGNVIYDENKICAVIDWEMCHLGYPLEDLAWAEMVIWQVGTNKAGALVTVDEWVRLYENKTSTRVDPEAYLFWQVFCLFKMGSLAYKAMLKTVEEKEKNLLMRLFSLMEKDIVSKLSLHEVG